VTEQWKLSPSRILIYQEDLSPVKHSKDSLVNVEDVRNKSLGECFPARQRFPSEREKDLFLTG